MTILPLFTVIKNYKTMGLSRGEVIRHRIRKRQGTNAHRMPIN